MKVFAAFFISIALFASASLGATAVRRSARDILQDIGGKDQAKRSSAIQELLELGPVAAPDMARFLDADSGLSSENRMILAKMLGNTKDPSGDTVLHRLVESDPNPLVRQAAAIGIALSKRSEHVKVLEHVLGKQGEDLAVRVRVAWALGCFGDRAGREIALAALRDPDKAHASAQYLAVEALESIGDPSTVSTLDASWRNDKNPWVRIWSKLASRRVQFRNLPVEKRHAFLAATLRDPQYELGVWSAQTLADDGSNESLDILRAASRDRENPGRGAASAVLSDLEKVKARRKPS